MQVRRHQTPKQPLSKVRKNDTLRSSSAGSLVANLDCALVSLKHGAPLRIPSESIVLLVSVGVSGCSGAFNGRSAGAAPSLPNQKNPVPRSWSPHPDSSDSEIDPSALHTLSTACPSADLYNALVEALGISPVTADPLSDEPVELIADSYQDITAHQRDEGSCFL